MDQLYTKIWNYIKATKDQQVQFKPPQHQVDINQKLARLNIDAQLQTIKKDYSTKIDHQIYNICQNIVFTFFSLNNQKFYAIIQRSKFWGMQLCIQQFIIQYYLYIKQNNRLRQFILLHLNKIVLTVCSIIQAQLIKKINLQDFTSSKNDLNNMKAKLKQNQDKLKQVTPTDLKQQTKVQIKSEQDVGKMKQDILAQLKKNNQLLEEL